MPCDRRVLADADPKTLVDETVALLRQGKLCVLPTETIYGIAVLPSHEDAVARIRALKGLDASHTFTWHLPDRMDAAPLAGDFSDRVTRLLDRYWPGPLTIVVPSSSADDGDSALPATDPDPAGNATPTVGLRLPAHDFTREVIRAAGQPLWLTGVHRAGEPPLLDPAAIHTQFGDALDLLVDDGISPLGNASTVVRDLGDRLEVLRAGILDADQVLHTAAELTLFVCTGNTCRSPLAEALARDLVSRHLEIDPGDVLARGFAFASAGISTLDGMPASDNSIAAGQELGLDLSNHQSQLVTPELMAHSTRVYCLSQSHRQALLAEFPDAARKIQMLRADQLDIRDPFGGPLEVYQKVRDEIRAAIGARVSDWLT
ncbi:MAG: Sua5/YciO/YrdC/YwlC family protein [bacterium]|nr:Sua5/YciO/YrdC/YwlC family protein [bacterium]